MLREIGAESRRIFRDVAVDSLLIACLVPNAITMFARARERRANESPRGEQLDNVISHVTLIRTDQIWPDKRSYLVCNHC